MVMNGDSLCKIDYSDFYSFHRRKKANMSMVLVKTKTVIGVGRVDVDHSNRITGFKEKCDGGDGLVSAGIYLMDNDIFSLMPDRKIFSMEYDLFPNLVETKRCYGFITDSELVDIGTPERYNAFRKNV